jgi:hypothetical protein
MQEYQEVRTFYALFGDVTALDLLPNILMKKN